MYDVWALIVDIIEFMLALAKNPLFAVIFKEVNISSTK